MSEQDITSAPNQAAPVKTVGRNEPCPCGSGVKYKRCHGVEAPPKLSERKMPEMPQSAAPGMMGMGPGGFDPSQMDPAMLMQMSQMLQRLPKGQMQKLQSIMQKAMSGKDVSREAQDFERLLPPDFVEAMKGFAMPGMPGMPSLDPSAATTHEEAEIVHGQAPVQLSADEARAIVEKAVKEGKVSADQVADLIPGSDISSEPAKKASFWSRFAGKK
jgi:hypothetical protein